MRTVFFEKVPSFFRFLPSFGIRLVGLFLCGHFNTEVTVFESGQRAILALATLFLTLIDVVVFLGWIDHGHESDDGSFQGAYGWTMSPSHLVIMVFSLWEWYDTWNGWIKDIDMVAYNLYNSYDVMSKFINNINITAVSTKSLGTISRSFRFWPKSI